MPELIKIGSTQRSPEQRRRELSKPTGIPTEFEIAYEIFTISIKELEKSVHQELDKCRLNFNREFFKTSVKNAITIIRNRAEELRLQSTFKSEGINETFEKYEAVEVLGRLKAKYPEMIRSEIVSVRIYQTKMRSCLEITEETIIRGDDLMPLVDQKIHRQDLGYIEGNSDPSKNSYALYFDPANPVSENARIFLEEFDDYSMLMCCSELFTEIAQKEIERNYRETL